MNIKIIFSLLFVQVSLCALPPITVYVHGSQHATKLLSKNIWYCHRGLHHISELPAESLFVKDAQLLCKSGDLRFKLDHYYTFGWSGKIDFTVRQKAGHELYEAIKNVLTKYYEQFGQYPVLRIITHSHGGNVALCMLQELPFFEGCNIELELVLLACPVQKVTENLINHPGISRSYVLYSTFDLIQKLDFYQYEGKRYWPARTFEAAESSNCFQVLVKVNGKRLAHTDFCHSVVRHIPEIICAVDQAVAKELYLMEYNIQDPGFVFYNGFNISGAMKAARKNK